MWTRIDRVYKIEEALEYIEEKIHIDKVLQKKIDICKLYLKWKTYDQIWEIFNITRQWVADHIHILLDFYKDLKKK